MPPSIRTLVDFDLMPSNPSSLQFRAAVIGCGTIGASASASEDVGILSHAEAIAACPQTDLVAFCDSDAGAVKNALNAYQLDQDAAFTSIDELLTKAKPQFVSIATPDATHASVAMKVLACESVRAVLLEKPIALDTAEAEKLVNTAKDRNIAFAVNFSRRYSRRFQTLRNEIYEGRFGLLQSVTGFYTKGILHNGSHWIDLLRFLTGEQITDVRAIPHNDTNDHDSTPDVDFRLASGVVAHLVGCDKDAFTLFEMDLLFSDGRIQMTDSGHSINVMRPQLSSRYAGYKFLEQETSTTQQPAMKDLMLYAVEDLVASVGETRIPISSASDALMAARVGKAVIESLQIDEMWLSVNSDRLK